MQGTHTSPVHGTPISPVRGGSVHGNPVQGKGLRSAHRTAIPPCTVTPAFPRRLHGNPPLPVYGIFPPRPAAAVQRPPGSFPPPPGAHLSAGPAVPPPVPVPQWRGGGRERGAPPPGPFIPTPRPPRAVKVGQDRGTVQPPPIGRRPGSPGRSLAAPRGRGPAPSPASREAKFQETWLPARSPGGGGAGGARGVGGCMGCGVL